MSLIEKLRSSFQEEERKSTERAAELHELTTAELELVAGGLEQNPGP